MGKTKTTSFLQLITFSLIKDNISYDVLVQDGQLDKDRLDELVDLMLETVCTRRKTIRVAGDDYPAELVKAKFMKLDSEHTGSRRRGGHRRRRGNGGRRLNFPCIAALYFAHNSAIIMCKKGGA